MINFIYILVVDFAERYKADCNRFQEENQNCMAKEKNREIINETNLKNMNSPIVKGTPPRFIHKTKKIQSNETTYSKHRYHNFSYETLKFLTTYLVLQK